MRKTWTQSRLERLYRYYNRRYWQGRLPVYYIRIVCLADGTLALCSSKAKRRISIDVAQCRSDRELKASLLHEMCHVAARRPNADAYARHGGHGRAFYRQLHKLPEWVIAEEWRVHIGMREKDFLQEKPIPALCFDCGIKLRESHHTRRVTRCPSCFSAHRNQPSISPLP
jgi:SprT-like family